MSILTLSAKLDRTDSTTPWGFRLHGGKDFSSPLSIQRVTPGSLAAKCGLQVGDEITKINETPTDGLFHKEAQQRIISAGNSLELSVTRGGGLHRAPPAADTYTPSPVSPGSAYNKPQAVPYSQNDVEPATNGNYNVKPKPFTPAGGSTVPVAMNNQYNSPINMYSVPSVMNSLSNQTAQMNVGSTGNPDISQHDTPPPLPSSQPPTLHEPPPHDPPVHDTHPPPHDPLPKSPGLYETRVSPPESRVTITSKVTEPMRPTVVSNRLKASSEPSGASSRPKPADPTPTQSAVYEDEDAEGVPRFRGYTNPHSQSRSFKILQEKIDSGEDFTPALGREKGPIKPVKATDDPDKYVKAIMNRQYNTPAGLYSQTNAEETFTVQASKLMQDMEQRESEAPPPAVDAKKPYVSSETYRLIQEEEASKPATQQTTDSQKQGPFNPLASYQTKQPDPPASYQSKDPGYQSKPLEAQRSPTYRPTDVTTEGPAYKPSYKSSAISPAAYKPSNSDALSSPVSYKSTVTSISPTYHSPGGSDDGSDTVVQNRATITITPKSTVEDSTVKELPGFRNASPRPFISNNNNDKPVYKNPSSAPGSSAPGTWKPSVPTGPRTMKVGRMGEARSMTAAQAGRVPMCSGCGVAIRGPFVLALDKSWCPNHFNCANPGCGRPLIDCGFVEEEGKLYCEKDYEQFLAPRCGKCGGAIVGEIVNAMKNTYHMNCFLCGQCHQPIGSASFHIEDGKIYCQKDWASLFQTKCYGCQFPIEPGDKWVEALGQNWHSECFNCSTCQVNLEGQPFYAKTGKPFCKKHAMGGQRY